jgi:hypothetical protein
MNALITHHAITSGALTTAEIDCAMAYAEAEKALATREAMRLTGANVPARDRRQRGVRCQALRYDRLLLPQRPTAPALAARDHLDPLRASTLTITRMSARISLRSRRADLRAVSTIMVQGHHVAGRQNNVGEAQRLHLICRHSNFRLLNVVQGRRRPCTLLKAGSTVTSDPDSRGQAKNLRAAHNAAIESLIPLGATRRRAATSLCGRHR